MQLSSAKPKKGVVYDSSFGETIDTVLALALLHGFEGKTQVRIAGLTSSKSNLKAAQVCDLVEKFYSSVNTGAAAIFFTAAPIGLTTDGKLAGDTPLLTKTLAATDATGKAVYSPRVRKLQDTAEPEIYIRNALTAQYDDNALVVMAGRATNLARLLALRGAKDLISRKVSFLTIAGGQYTGSKPDPVFAADIPAMRQVLEQWPTPIYLAGNEVGAALPYPGESVETDFAYNPAHPVAECYRNAQAMPYNASTTAMAAVLYTARQDDGNFRLSEPGTVSVADDGSTRFQASASGKHRYLIVDPSRKEAVIQTYRELASAKPVRRVFRRAVEEQDAKPDAKPQEKAKPPVSR